MTLLKVQCTSFLKRQNCTQFLENKITKQINNTTGLGYWKKKFKNEVNEENVEKNVRMKMTIIS